MDGREVNEQNPQVIATTDRKEPTAFFFVIFGLVYEAIATASSDGSSESRSGVISDACYFRRDPTTVWINWIGCTFVNVSSCALPADLFPYTQASHLAFSCEQYL
jgi:hypothetical protein